MENTLENKARFFAQYWGQKVRRPAKGLPLATAHSDIFCWLELKKLSDITDEDLKKIDMSKKDWDFLFDGNPNQDLTAEAFDKLRGLGYALPFNGLSVEQQIEYNWIKLK